MPPKAVFKGETFCVSGKFSLSQGEMRALISDNGGQSPPFTDPSTHGGATCFDPLERNERCNVNYER
jgi:hypothetical protein